MPDMHRQHWTAPETAGIRSAYTAQFVKELKSTDKNRVILFVIASLGETEHLIGKLNIWQKDKLEVGLIISQDRLHFNKPS